MMLSLWVNSKIAVHSSHPFRQCSPHILTTKISTRLTPQALGEPYWSPAGSLWTF